MPPYRKSQLGWLTGNSLAPITGRGLLIPGDLAFVMAVNGALDELTYASNWEKFGTVTPEAAADAMRIMLADYFESEYTPVIGDSEFHLAAPEMTLGGGSAVVWGSDTAQRENGYGYQSPAVNGQWISAWRWLMAGVWDYSFWYMGSTDQAILRLQIAPPEGGLDNHDHDLYRTPVTRNLQVTGSFTILQSGLTGIHWFANGKRAASTGYLMRITRMDAWRRP